jgi:hypothetical protein
VPAHQRSWPAPAGGGDDACTQAGSLRHGERLQPDLTQRDMWVMHRAPSPGVPWERALRRTPHPTPLRHLLGAHTSGAPLSPGSTCLRRTPHPTPLRRVLGAHTSGALTTPDTAPARPGSARLRRAHHRHRLGISWERARSGALPTRHHPASPGSARLRRAPHRHHLGISWERAPPARSPPTPPTVPASSGGLQTRTGTQQRTPSGTGGSCLCKERIRIGAFRASPTPIACTLTYSVRPRTSRIMPARLRSSSIPLPVPQHRA